MDALRRVQDDYRSHSREVLLEEWLERPLRTQVLDNLSRLTATEQ